ncbi:hypothetical protein N2601_33315 (plasmid) [Rhizobium sp. CB3060]|uniref:hypothetical protein n=1 Tax=Rhizobium sp. CB3060 TaxID=3138255 RepID=UPI0021A72DA5|nr:hypothetical protein [Rhizobium tropici]UWU25950.1 hypothetical protein N2601_33315 [Rhizobium tropici]
MTKKPTPSIDHVQELIARYGLRPGDAVPQKGRLHYSTNYRIGYDDLTRLLDAAVTEGVLEHRGGDSYFVR